VANPSLEEPCKLGLIAVEWPGGTELNELQTRQYLSECDAYLEHLISVGKPCCKVKQTTHWSGRVRGLCD
jgi:hypothetical protein